MSHSVFVAFKPGAPEPAIQEFIDALDEFPANKPGLRRWISGKTGPYYPSASKEFTHAFCCEVDSPQAMLDYASHPFHREAAKHMGPIVDHYLVLDFEYTRVQQSAVVHQVSGDGQQAVAHVVMLKFKEEVPAEQVQEFITLLDRFPREKPHIRRWISGKTGPFYPSATKDYTYAFIAEVDSIEAMKEYAVHPYHRDVVGPKLGPIMEKVLVVDFAFSRVMQSAQDYFQVVRYR
ncbi:MAG: Dabb family protein [Chloroflexi bacterium]|nr:Dabb family protein [Chloroflexota bacterium]